jgi:hypothetical protein
MAEGEFPRNDMLLLRQMLHSDLLNR